MSEALPADWAWKPLGELADVVSGGTPSKNEPAFWEGGTIPWATPSDITKTSGRVLLETGDRITDLGLSASAARKLPVGSVLMTSRATLGEAKVAGVATTTNQGFKSLIPKGEIETWYLFYQIQNSKSRYSVFGKGTTFLEVNTKDTLRLLIPHAPLPQQRRIATILTTLDEVIEATEKLVEKHQQIKAGLMHDLFTRGLWTQAELNRGDHHGLPCEATAQEGQLRPRPEEAPGLYQESPLGLIPKAWDVKTIQDVIEIERGFAFSSSDYQSTGILNFRVSNVGLSNEDLRNTEYLPPSFWTTFSQQQLLGGEIVIVMVGATTGKIGRVPEELCPALLNQNLWHLRTKSGFDREFAWNAMPMIVAGHMRLSQGSARDFLKQSDFNKTLTICPAIDEQRGITAALNSISHRIDREQQLNRKLRQQKQGLMHDLLTGKVRVGADANQGNHSA